MGVTRNSFDGGDTEAVTFTKSNGDRLTLIYRLHQPKLDTITPPMTPGNDTIIGVPSTLEELQKLKQIRENGL